MEIIAGVLLDLEVMQVMDILAQIINNGAQEEEEVDMAVVEVMQVQIVAVGGLVGPEFAFLVEIASVLGVDYLVAPSLGINGDGPFALLWLCVVYLVCPYGIVACA